MPPQQPYPPQQPQPYGQPPQQPAGIGGPADLFTRIIARFIDGVILAVVNMIFVVFLIFGVILSASGVGFGFGGFSGWGLLSSLITTAIIVGYFAYLESSKGQTLGKMAMKIKVLGPDGQNPTMEQALKRNAWLALGIVPIVGGLLYLGAVIYIIVTINGNAATGQGWHDEFAGGTRVIKVG